MPVMEGMIEPITLRYADSKKNSKPAHLSPEQTHSQPAILTNLSAGGMSLVTFIEPPHTKRLDMVLTLPGLDHIPIEGKVVRIHEKGETYSVGISFTKITPHHQKTISDQAQDYMDCETRLALSLPEACVPACRFHLLCTKPQKAPHWPPKA